MLDRMKGPILKSRDEIAVMDRANRVVLEILEILRGMIKAGVTTAQLNAVAEEELARRGAKSPFKNYAPMNLPPQARPGGGAIQSQPLSPPPGTKPKREVTAPPQGAPL